ncbi:MAG: hypothetical protein EXR75_10050 [Myxococcales bacterium]|nr:hypothetical protein [Myxococcales bacterium]
MIRVNLLPNAGERRVAAQGGQTWILVVMGVFVFEIMGLFFFHQTKEEELALLLGEVGKLESQVSEINELVKDHAKVKTAIEEYQAREDAIAKLQAGRKGPTSVLLELSKVLTKGKGPTADQAKLDKAKSDNPLAVYNATWDSRRVWLTKYEEKDRTVLLEGVARDGGDVYEFAQRLRLSRYFNDVRLREGEQNANADKVDLVQFGLEVKVEY